MTEVRAVAYERLEHFVVLAIGAEGDTLRRAAVFVACTESQPAAHRHIDRGREGHVHQLVLVAQVLVLGIVGSQVVGSQTQGYALIEVDAHSAGEVVGVAMLASGIGQRVFNYVERLSCWVDEGRTSHVLAREVVVANGSVDHGAAADAAQRLHGSRDVERRGRLIVVYQPSVCMAHGQLCLRNVVGAEACECCHIVRSEPPVATAHEVIAAREQRVRTRSTGEQGIRIESKERQAICNTHRCHYCQLDYSITVAHRRPLLWLFCLA